MLETVRSHPSFQDLQPQADEQRRLARRKLAVKITSLEPRVFVKLTDNWIELGMVYPVDNDLRRTFRSGSDQQILSPIRRSQHHHCIADGGYYAFSDQQRVNGRVTGTPHEMRRFHLQTSALRYNHPIQLMRFWR